MRRCDGRRGSIARARRLTLRPLAMLSAETERAEPHGTAILRFQAASFLAAGHKKLFTDFPYILTGDPPRKIT